MTVITGPNHEEIYHLDAAVCVACGNPPGTYPFIFWSTKADGDGFALCGECCHSLKRGLTADLIHAGAIMDMRACGYRHFILEKRMLPATGGNPTRRARKDATVTLRRVAGRDME